MKLYLTAFSFCIFISCTKKGDESVDITTSAIKTDSTEIAIKNKPVAIYKDTVEFVDYNDDGDFLDLNVLKNNDETSYNNDVDDRNLLRGDIIEVSWKRDTVYIAGDGDTPMETETAVSIVKLKDGNVSKFRKNYGKELKYVRATDSDFSESYLDKIYLIVEYYIANSKNELVKMHVSKKDTLTYSVEETSRKGKPYMMIGLGTEFEHHTNIVQWLYIDIESYALFEYDLANDNLVKFK